MNGKVLSARFSPAVTVILLLVLLGGSAAVYLMTVQVSVVRAVQQTVESEARLNRVETLIAAASASQRGYLLSSNPGFLDRFQLANRQLIPEIDALARQTAAGNPAQMRNIAALKQVAASFVDSLRGPLQAATAAQGVAAAKLASATQLQLINQLGQIIPEIRDSDRAELQRRDRRFADVNLAAVSTRFATLLLLLTLAGIVYRDAGRRVAQIETVNARLKKEMAEREAAESKVRQLQKMEAIGQLTGGIAHDFNNMLAVVIGSLDLAYRRIGDNSAALKYIDSAMEGAKRAAALTTRMLAFARQQTLQPRPVYANELIAGMSELIQRSIGGRIRLDIELQSGGWPIHADPAQIENALLNLTVNARDAMPDGGRLTIRTENVEQRRDAGRFGAEAKPGDYVSITVSDTGAGMPPEALERAFDPFYTTKDPGRGTGLGLSQVFGFVKQSGGFVDLSSEVGRGTSVSLYLPRHMDEMLPSGTPGRVAALPLAKSGETVLVVEDDPTVGRITADNLEELGYSVVQALSPGRALAQISGEPRIRLLLTDIVMPELSGRELAQLAQQRRPGLKVLFTSAYDRNAAIHNGALDTATNFLPKPFTIEQLALKVRQTLDAR